MAIPLDLRLGNVPNHRDQNAVESYQNCVARAHANSRIPQRREIKDGKTLYEASEYSIISSRS